MAQQVKELKVRLNGEVGKGVNSISNSLSEMGSLLDQIGGKTREFQKDSLKVYQGYEDNMLAAKYALSSQYTSATQLSRVMDTLHDSAQTWAASTIFHTDDVSKAINEAAHAGWSLEEIMEGVPDAMKIAQAGGLDLSTGLDYLIKMANSTGTEFGDMGTLIDQWAMAANSSATNIQELGEAFMSMGSAAQFGDSTAELFTMLGVLANVGTTGSQAGTALRSAMVRLIAPTTKAESAMDLLGADAEELEEVLTNTNVTKAVKQLEGLGWSAYENGKLKSIKDIFGQLFDVTQELDEAARNEIISAIFPTRTIATALALMSASGSEIDELYDKISNSEGYAQQGSEIMMSGLTGSIETLASKWEEFKRSIGETMAPEVESVAGFLGNITDSINALPQETLSGLTAMLTTLSAAGPLMLGAGAVSKLFATLGLKGTGILAAALGLSFAVGYIKELNKEEYNGHFGTMKLDVDGLMESVKGITTTFDTEKQAMSEWQTAVTEARETYDATVTEFSEKTLKELLVGGEFTQDDFDALSSDAEQMGKAVLAGIENAHAKDLTLLDALFGGDETAEGRAAFAEGAALSQGYWGDAYAQAEQIGQNIKDKLTEALKNGELTQDDRDAIQAQIARYNEIMSQIAEGELAADYYARMERAHRVDAESVNDFLTEMEAGRLNAIDNVQNQYYRLIGAQKAAWMDARSRGQSTVTMPDGTVVPIETAESFEDTALYASLITAMNARVDEENRKYNDVSLEAIDAKMRDSEYGDAWRFMRGLEQNGEGGFNFADAFVGMTREELETLNEQLGDLWASNIPGHLSLEEGPLADYIGSIFSGAGAKEASDLAAQWAMQAGMNGWATVPTEAAIAQEAAVRGVEGEMAAVEAKIAQLEAKKTEAEKSIADSEAWLERNSGTWRDGIFGNTAGNQSNIAGQNEIIQSLNLDIAEAESDLAELQKKLDALTQPKTIPVDIVYRTPGKILPPKAGENIAAFAEGGRATEASVFGEMGPEWAIPEKHDDRTAELLDAARRASGFTWADLISRNGGLNSRPERDSLVVHYSPTINAGDANGVASVLTADKNRLVRILKDAMDEMKYRDNMEVFA